MVETASVGTGSSCAASAVDVATACDRRDRTLKRRPWRMKVTPWSDILQHEYKGSGTDSDPYVVTWLPRDPENPITFGFVYKWSMTMLAATGTLSVGFGSSMLSAAITSLRAAFPGHNDQMYIMITSIFVLGFVVGPLLWAPGSEVFGRRNMFIFTYVPFTAFNAGVCGVNSLNALLVMRFFAGTFGASTMTNSGGIIADMFEAQQRGLAMGVFSFMPMVGPAIGPLAGGFLSMNASWRWVAAVIALFAAVLTLVSTILLPETYAPVLLRKRAKRLTKATGKVYRAQQDVAKPLDTKTLFLNQLKVPFVLLFTEPIVAVISLYMAIVYAIFFMQFTSFPLVFQQYRHWSPGVSALAFIGVTLGSFFALAFIVLVENPRYARLHKTRGYLPPEVRLFGVTIGAIFLPIGLFIFAWTCVPATIHWIAPLIGTVFFGWGMISLFLGLSNYLVDSYLMLAASVLAGGTVTRSILGVVFPLFTVDMYKALNPNWAGTLLAFLAVIFVPVPLLLQKFGPKIRRMTKAGRDADDLGHMLVKMMAAQRAQAAGASAQATGADAPLAPTTTTEDEKKDGAGLSHDEELAIEQAPRLDTESHGGVTK